METHPEKPEKQDIFPVIQSGKDFTMSNTVWETFQSGLDEFTEDIFQDGRDQGVQQKREPL